MLRSIWFFCFMIFWGIWLLLTRLMFFILVAQHAPPQTRGTALHHCYFALALPLLSAFSFRCVERCFFNNSLIFLILALANLLALLVCSEKRKRLHLGISWSLVISIRILNQTLFYAINTCGGFAFSLAELYQAMPGVSQTFWSPPRY